MFLVNKKIKTEKARQVRHTKVMIISVAKSRKKHLFCDACMHVREYFDDYCKILHQTHNIGNNTTNFTQDFMGLLIARYNHTDKNCP